MERRKATDRLEPRKPDPFLNFVLDQLGSLTGVRARAMFGGHGLYRGDVFFGIVFRGALYLKDEVARLPEGGGREGQGGQQYRGRTCSVHGALV
ncbi:MAG: TfoX/Sxy family protein [Planctomycetes bacterium]|nr:TfoX/Sxy family protein [Planctomycetota bacterium]